MSHENATQISVGQTGTKFLVVVCLMALGFAAAGCIVAGNAIQKANKAEEEQGKRIGVVSCKAGHTNTDLRTSKAKSSCKAALNFIER